MLRICALLLVCSYAVADEPSKSNIVKNLAKDFFDAGWSGDYAKMVDNTYPEVVKVFGGRKQAIELAESTMNQVKASVNAAGLSIDGYKIGEPGEFITENDTIYVVIPTTMEFSFKGGKARGRSYLIGISSDSGKVWKFVDGGGMQDTKFRDKVFPKFPAKLKLPVPEKTEFFKDKQ